MRLLVVVIAYVALCYGNAIPEIPKDNSHYVDGESRYIWMKRGDGELTLVDLQEPIDSSMMAAKSEPKNEYWLYTRQNLQSYQLLVDGNSDTVFRSNFRADKPTYVLVHGWTSRATDRFSRVIREAVLDTEDCNVIVVDWREVAARSYVLAVEGTPGVGESIGHFLEWLLATTGADWNRVHLLGYSLGGHAIASAGRITGGRVARLTGFDPAGPLWWTHRYRLKSDNGQYVEGIHTNGGVQGIRNPVGHVDFYPNGGGPNQPGCSDINCSHARAYEFFASSISTGHLVGRQCRTFTQAVGNRCTGTTLSLGGTDMDKRGNGLYAMETGSSWPF